ncbi:hypothetical protein F7725_025973, partial [Dissostichus mawsoni]
FSEARAPTGVQGRAWRVQGSWGAWGSWSACSRTCGRGVQEQSRPCLPVYTPSQYPSRREGVHPQQPGHIISALRPTVPLHRSAGRSANSSRRGDLREGKEARPGGRRRVPHIVPGRYGYGSAPHVAPLQTHAGRSSETTRPHRQRRSPAEARHHQHQQQQQHQHHQQQQQQHHHQHQHHHQPPTADHNQDPSNSLHHPSRPFMPPRNNQVWAPLYQPGSGPQTQDQQGPGSSLQTSGTPSSLRGPTAPCPAPPAAGSRRTTGSATATKHIRAVQCSSYNNKPFMGRLYEWEPFNEVPEDQHCELNCRASGSVRESDRRDAVWTKRNFSLRSGKMFVPGIRKGDGQVRCVGGENTTCRLVSGVFKHSLTKIGYHKIVEIPEGATKINVTEMYEGAGTMFTYRRPNEIRSTAGESFLAEGPTNEILDVYMIFQQPNPGIHYEYTIPEKPVDPQPPNHRPEVNAVNGQEDTTSEKHSPGNYNPAGGGRDPPRLPDNQVPVVQPPNAPETTTGRYLELQRFRYSIFHCVSRLNQGQVSEALCDSSSKASPQEEACNLQPCPAFSWDIGEWSECSKTCGLGMQHRQVLCRQIYANRTLNVHTSRCEHLERPEITSSCQLKICSEWQVRSEWSACSVPCGLGQRSREVRCVSNVGDFVPDEECNMNLRPVDVENCDMGSCAKSWFYTEWGNRCSAECGMGVRTRGVLCLTNLVSGLPLEGCGSERPQNSQQSAVRAAIRAVVCLMKSEEGLSVVPPYECSSLDRPLGQQSCTLKACGAKWFHTDWSACSKTCEGGFRVREVRCLSDDSLPSDACDQKLKPGGREDCSPDPCTPNIVAQKQKQSVQRQSVQRSRS